MGINFRLPIMPRKATRMNLLRILGLIGLFITSVLVLAYIVAAFVLTIITSLFYTT
jgi:hypothetical protein